MSVVSQLATWEREAQLGREVVAKWIQTIRKKRDPCPSEGKKASQDARTKDAKIANKVCTIEKPDAFGENESPQRGDFSSFERSLTVIADVGQRD